MTSRSILVLTNSGDATSDYLVSSLRQGGLQVVRYDTDLDIVDTRFSYSNGLPVMSWKSHELQPASFSILIYRRPQPFQPAIGGDPTHMRHVADEWAEVWEGFLGHIPTEKWINHPARNFVASHKVEQLTRAQRCGLNVPETVVTSNEDEARQFCRRISAGVVVKPMASGYLERRRQPGDTVIYTRGFTDSHHGLLKEIGACPVLFQQRIDKSLDVRVTVIDDHYSFISLKKHDLTGDQILDIRRDNMRDVEYSPVDMPERDLESLKSLIRGYGLRFAAIDFAVDRVGKWYFLELNPNGQWAWLDIQAGFNIAENFVSALNSSEVED